MILMSGHLSVYLNATNFYLKSIFLEERVFVASNSRETHCVTIESRLPIKFRRSEYKTTIFTQENLHDFIYNANYS